MKFLEGDPYISSLKEKLDMLGVKGILFDLDDTLIYTAEIFERFMGEYADAVAEGTEIDRNTFYKALSDINDEEYKRMGVSPQRWVSVVGKLEEMFEDTTGMVQKNLDVLSKIYSTVPRIRPGVKEILDTLKETGVKLGLVTHANVDWTNWKLDQLDLRDYFEVIKIVDENGHKTSVDWGDAVEMMGLLPGECIFTGDSLRGDIEPAVEVGAIPIWLPSPWLMYRMGLVPEGVHEIGEFDEFLEALDRLSNEGRVK